MIDRTKEAIEGQFPIELEKYDTKWKKWYTAEKRLLTGVVGIKNIKRISHIGSTSVEKMMARPIIDILLEMDEKYDFSRLPDVLGQIGYTDCVQEKDGFFIFYKGYSAGMREEKIYHLYVRRFGNWDELYFRDYLRLHKNEANEYSKLKIELEKTYQSNYQAYTKAKENLIQQYTMLARRTLRNKYDPNKWVQ